MEAEEPVYITIDLKSFYASVECVERGLDPLTTNLVVADAVRTNKTICLAVSPALKSYGISGRARLFEVVRRVKEVNCERRMRAPGGRLDGSSCSDLDLKRSPELAVDYIVAPPRMALYIEYSRRIYDVYLKYLAPEDMHVYSIDEVMCDITGYLKTYDMSPRELAAEMIRDVWRTTGITAAAGIGPNLYLAKVAMDIMAKRVAPDMHGVRIAELDEMSYRRHLWNHQPLTDFWRVGHGYKKRLEAQGLFTMGDVARCSLGKAGDYYNEDLLYKLFGINAELLIDHAWGLEPCTMAHIKAYKPDTNSTGSGQVLQCPYSFEKARLIVREMTDQLALDLVEKKLVTDQLVLTVGYDIENLSKEHIKKQYKGQIVRDRYGRSIPKHAHGTVNLKERTSSAKCIVEAVLGLYDRIVDERLFVRRINVTANRVVGEEALEREEVFEQMDLFTDYSALQEARRKRKADLERERKIQLAMLTVKKRFGKNAILKGTDLEEGAMTMERNRQIGGHKA